MTESRTPRLRAIVGTLAVLLLSACSDATEPAPEKSQSTLEDDLQRTHRHLEQSRQALGAAERRLRALSEEQAQSKNPAANRPDSVGSASGENSNPGPDSSLRRIR